MAQILLAPRLHQVALALLMTALVSELFLANLDVGPFSPRVYLLTGLLGLVLFRAAHSGERMLRTEQATRLILVYLVFILWATANRLYNAEPLSTVVYQTASTHLLALVAFVLAQALVRQRREAVLLSALMVLTTFISGVVGMLQWFGAEQAWNLALLLHPGDELRVKVLGIRVAAYGFVPGLALTSLHLSYHLLSFGLFPLAWLVCQPPGRTLSLKRIVAVSRFCLLATVLFLAQSRGALLAGFLALVLALAYSFRLRARSLLSAHAGRGVAAICLTLAVVGLIYLLSGQAVDPEPSAGGGRYPLSRVFKLTDPLRLELATTVIEFGQRHLWIGGGVAQYNDFLSETSSLSRGPYSPHNTFLNALVYYGLPGVMLLLALLVVVLRTCRQALAVTAADPARGWIALGASLGLIAYLIETWS